MKKLLLMTTLIMASSTRCDQLLDVINQHNLQKVTLLLQQKEYDATNYEQYITAAHEVVERCKNDMKTQDLEPTAIQKMAVISCMLASCYPIYTFIKTHAKYGFDDINYTDLIAPAAQFIGACMVASFAITIPMVLGFMPLCNAYQDAIDVEKLLRAHQFE